MRAREFGLLALLIALLVYAKIVDPSFMTLRAQGFLAPHVWELAIVALPMFLIIVSGGIDLSVGSIVALSAVTLGLLYERGASIWVATTVAIGAGAFQGWLNGMCVAKLKVHPLIVTLATMAAFRGVAEGISLARPLSNYPDAFQNLSSGKILGLPIPSLLFGLLAVVFGVVMARTVLGRWIYAIGIKEKAALFSKIPVNRIKILLYTLSGLCCGVAAIILVARSNTAKADLATGMELDVITAVVLGGASIEGGEGSVTGLLLGLVLIHEAREFVTWHWKQSELNLIVIGGLLIASVLLQKLFQRRSRVVSKATA